MTAKEIFSLGSHPFAASLRPGFDYRAERHGRSGSAPNLCLTLFAEPIDSARPVLRKALRNTVSRARP